MTLLFATSTEHRTAVKGQNSALKYAITERMSHLSKAD